MPVQLIIVSAIVFGPLSGWLAGHRRRPRLAWLLFGTMLGPLAPALLLLAPPGTCRACGADARGWHRTCASCGRRLDGTAQPGALPAKQAHALEAPAVQAHPLDAPAVTATVAAGGSVIAEAVAAGAIAEAPAPAHGAVETPAPSGTAAPSGTPPPRGTPPDRAAPARWWQATRVAVPSVEAAPVARGGLAAASPIPDAEAVLETLGAGVFVGGTGALSIGSRYIIAREGESLVLQGPVDVDPSNVALRRPRRGLEASIIEGRLVISEMAGGRLAFAVAFTTLTGAPVHDLERDIPLADARPTLQAAAPETATTAEAAAAPETATAPEAAPMREAATTPEVEPAPDAEATRSAAEVTPTHEVAAAPEVAAPEVAAVPEVAAPPPSDVEPEAERIPVAETPGEPPSPTKARRIRAPRAASGATAARRPSARKSDRKP